MEHVGSDQPVATPPRVPLKRALVAVGMTLALYLAPFLYFFTACGTLGGFMDRLQWAGFMVAIVTYVGFPYVALGATALVTILFAASHTPQTTRIRNVVVSVALVASVGGSLAYGIMASVSCSLF